MEWLSQNWAWIILLGACLGMHLFGHRRHGVAGGYCGGGCDKGGKPEEDGKRPPNDVIERLPWK